MDLGPLKNEKNTKRLTQLLAQTHSLTFTLNLENHFELKSNLNLKITLTESIRILDSHTSVLQPTS